jgi:hypothetical protein
MSVDGAPAIPTLDSTTAWKRLAVIYIQQASIAARQTGSATSFTLRLNAIAIKCSC